MRKVYYKLRQKLNIYAVTQNIQYGAPIPNWAPKHGRRKEGQGEALVLLILKLIFSY